jgi:endonuclease/exonuclease/phosphatase (EEP) superfamily protein YafD
MIGWLLAFLCLVVAVVTGLSFMHHWRFALASHFRPHLAVLSIVLAILVSLAGLPGWATSLAALLALLATAANLFSIWRVLPSFSSASGEDGARLRIAFANLCTTNRNRAAVVAWILRENVDVLVVAECEGEWPEALATLGESFPHGTETDTEAGPLSLIGLHAAMPRSGRYSTGRDAMIETVGHIVWRRPGGVVVVGDFNATPWSIPMRRLMAGRRLSYGPGAFRGTFPSWLPDWAGIPIDMVLAGGGWRVVGHRHGPRIGSDHWPVLTEVAAVKAPV